MNGKDAIESEQNPEEIKAVPISPYSEARKASIEEAKAKAKADDEAKVLLSGKKKKKSTGKSLMNFLYDPRKKTIFGRSSLNWGKYQKETKVINHIFFLFLYSS